jgi:hypothetical protein
LGGWDSAPSRPSALPVLKEKESALAGVASQTAAVAVIVTRFIVLISTSMFSRRRALLPSSFACSRISRAGPLTESLAKRLDVSFRYRAWVAEWRPPGKYGASGVRIQEWQAEGSADQAYGLTLLNVRAHPGCGSTDQLELLAVRPDLARLRAVIGDGDVECVTSERGSGGGG